MYGVIIVFLEQYNIPRVLYEIQKERKDNERKDGYCS